MYSRLVIMEMIFTEHNPGGTRGGKGLVPQWEALPLPHQLFMAKFGIFAPSEMHFAPSSAATLQTYTVCKAKKKKLFGCLPGPAPNF